MCQTCGDIKISEKAVGQPRGDSPGTLTPFESIKSGLAFRHMSTICFHVPWVAMESSDSPPPL